MASAFDSQNTPRPVITGMGIVTPLARNLEDLLSAIQQGQHVLGAPRHFDASVLPAATCADFRADDVDFKVSEDDRKWLDRGAWFLLSATQDAMRHAGLTPALLDPFRTGVSIGSQHIGIERLEQFFQANGAGKLDELDPRIAVFASPAMQPAPSAGWSARWVPNVPFAPLARPAAALSAWRSR